MLHGDLAADRHTIDCDMIRVEPEESLADLKQAAALVASQMGLKNDWLNNESRVFAWLIPPGWTTRLRPFDTFGPLEVMTLSRRDLLAMKLRSMAKRSKDLADIDAICPTAEEIDFLLGYLDQAEMESLDRETFDDQRAFLLELKQAHEA